MLTWNVTYHCKSGQREAFYQALCDLGIRANSLKEEGNLKYDYFLAAEAPELVRRWRAGPRRSSSRPTARRRSSAVFRS